MSDNSIYIEGKVKGFYIPSEEFATQNFHFSNFDFKHLEIKNAKTIASVNFEELKTGLYHQPTRIINDIRVFVSDDEFIEYSTRDILFKNLEIIGEKNIEGTKMIEFQSDAFLKVPKPIVKLPTTTNLDGTPIAETKKKLVSFSGLTKGIDFSGSDSWAFKISSFIISLLTLIGIGLLLFYFFVSIFGNSFIGVLIFGYLLYSFLITSLSKLFGSEFVVTHPLRHILGFFLLLAGIYTLLNSNHINGIPLIVLGLGLMLNAGPWNKGLLRILGSLLILASIYLFYESNKHKIKERDDDRKETRDDSDDVVPQPEEETEEEVVGNDTNQVAYLKHRLKWYDNRKNYYEGNFKVQQNHFYASRTSREQLEVQEISSNQFWYRVYNNLVNKNSSYLDKIVGEYKKIAKRKKLSRNEFVDMVVTSVQYIPYYLVHELSHEEADEKYGGFISEYHETGKPCLEEIKFGLQAPTEFIGNLKGDCDTRSCFLYCILNKCGIPAVILVSEEYGHAVIGVAGNYSGDHVKYKGLKFYAWETTNKGFVPGALSPECNNMRYWSVALGVNMN